VTFWRHLLASPSGVTFWRHLLASPSGVTFWRHLLASPSVYQPILDPTDSVRGIAVRFVP
ncbi:hypothetical protein, partial [Burkholderia aenigmatica]|uniref:hypothetical protein n=1 Tax=Burkholderia aenigmatica TaxID=2015348 RepID=UPI001C2E88AB